MASSSSPRTDGGDFDRTPRMSPEEGVLELLPSLNITGGPSSGGKGLFRAPSWSGGLTNSANVDWSYSETERAQVARNSARFNWKRSSSEPIFPRNSSNCPSMSPSPTPSDSATSLQGGPASAPNRTASSGITQVAASYTPLNASAAAFKSRLNNRPSGPVQFEADRHSQYRGQSQSPTPRGPAQLNRRRKKDRKWDSRNKGGGGRHHTDVWVGRLKSFSIANNQGFIMSTDLKAIYGRDVYLHGAQWEKANRPHVGTLLRFTVTLNEKGHPQARNVSICVWTAEDQLQIQNHINEFSICLDGGDVQRARILCTPDCQFEVSARDKEASCSLEQLQTALKVSGQRYQHIESSYVIKLMSRGTARNASYWHAYLKGKLVAYGTRKDTLALYQSEWKFIHRVISVTWCESSYSIAALPSEVFNNQVDKASRNWQMHATDPIAG